MEFHNPGVAMSQRDQALIADWESRLLANALAVRILGKLNERKAEVERCALDGLQRENPQFERAASPQFRAEALGHCNDILKSMLAIASGAARALGDDPFHFVVSHAVRRARQQFPLAGSLNAYRFAHKGYWEVMRNSVLSAPAAEGDKTDCLMLLSEFLLEFFDRISGIMTDAYIAEEKRMIARRTAPMWRWSRISCMGGSPAISRRRICANERASVPARRWRSRSRGSARPRTAG